jgi:hypothetical protein
MSRWKGIIEGVGDKRRQASYDILRARTPRIDTKIHYTIDNKSEDNRRKYLEGCDFISIILSRYTIEPEYQEKYCYENDDGFTKNLYECRVGIWYEPSSFDEEGSIE